MAIRKLRWAGNSLVITIPKHYRQLKGWTEDTQLEWVNHPEGLLLRPKPTTQEADVKPEGSEIR